MASKSQRAQLRAVLLRHIRSPAPARALLRKSTADLSIHSECKSRQASAIIVHSQILTASFSGAYFKPRTDLRNVPRSCDTETAH